MRNRLILVAMFALALAALACADEASAPTEDEEPSPIGAQPGVDQPPEPTLGEGVTELARKTIVIAPSPGIPYSLTPHEIELSEGGEPPPCDRFVFAFGWLVVDPPEPGEDFDLTWIFTGDGQTQEVGRGVSGVAEVGCGVLTVTNGTNQNISVAVEYASGESP
jgi:hypothetical protein